MEAAVQWRCRRSRRGSGWPGSSRRWRGGCRIVRQRENALLYVRGLIEHGRSEELAADAVSARGDAGAVRVGAAVSGRLALGSGAAGAGLRGAGGAARSGCRRGSSTTRGSSKDGKHSPGVKRQYSGTLGKIGNCQITVSRARGRRARDAAARLARCICPRSGATDRPRRRKAKIPDAVVLRDEAAARRRALSSRRPAGSSRAAPILADCAYGDDSRLPHRPARARARVRARGRAPRSSVYGPETTFAVPERNGATGRPRDGRASRPQAASRCARSPSGCPRGVADAALPDDAGGRGHHEPVRVRPRRRHPSGPQPTTCRRARSG